jgi:hypothetical protein
MTMKALPGGAVEPARFRGPVGNSHLSGERAIAPGVHFQAGRNVTFIRGLARWASAHLQALGLSLLLVITASTVLWFFAFFVGAQWELPGACGA